MSGVVVRRALSVGLAASLYGLSLGALGVAAGLTVAQTCAMSLLLFTGGSQFALVGIIGGGGSAASAITASSLLGIRNGLYGLQLKPILGARAAARRRRAADDRRVDGCRGHPGRAGRAAPRVLDHGRRDLPRLEPDDVHRRARR
jgi:AzlC protein